MGGRTAGRVITGGLGILYGLLFIGLWILPLGRPLGSGDWLEWEVGVWIRDHGLGAGPPAERGYDFLIWGFYALVMSLLLGLRKLNPGGVDVRLARIMVWAAAGLVVVSPWNDNSFTAKGFFLMFHLPLILAHAVWVPKLERQGEPCGVFDGLVVAAVVLAVFSMANGGGSLILVEMGVVAALLLESGRMAWRVESRMMVEASALKKPEKNQQTR